MPKKSSTSNPSPHAQHVAPGSVRRAHFRFRLWHALVLILLIIIVGVLIIRLSRASNTDVNGRAAQTITDSDINQYTNQFTTQISKPAQLVSGNLPLQYTPKNNVSVSFVAYYVDGKLQATANEPPYRFVLNTQNLPDGNHAVAVVAYDANSVVVGFSYQQIKVNNSGLFSQLNHVVSYPWQVIFGED